MARKEFTITRTLDAPREAVWRAWTDPALAAQWWHPHEVVTPPDSARLDGATSVVVQQVCPGTTLTHGDLPRSPLVAAVVLEALDVAPGPAAYGAGDCARLSS